MKKFKDIICKIFFKILLCFLIMCLAIITRTIKIIHTLYLKHKLKLKNLYRNLLKALVVFRNINKETKVLVLERSVFNG